MAYAFVVCTGEKEERETKDKVEGCVQEGHADCRTERGR